MSLAPNQLPITNYQLTLTYEKRTIQYLSSGDVAVSDGGGEGDGEDEGGEAEEGARTERKSKKKGTGSAARRAEKRKREGDERQGRN